MKKLMSGSEAAARGAYEAGVRVVSSYPGMLGAEITEKIALYKNVYAEWAPNEKAACETALGAAAAGARSMTCTDSEGLNNMSSAIFAASRMSVSGGMVICTADDTAFRVPFIGRDSRKYARLTGLAMLEPADSQECRDYMLAAYELSEMYGLPVFIRFTARALYSYSMTETGRLKETPLRDFMKSSGKYEITRQWIEKQYKDGDMRLEALREYAQTTPLNRIEFHSGKTGVITSGVCYCHAKEALGDSVSYLKLGMIYPLPVELIKNFADNVEKVYVIEESESFIEKCCREAGIDVIGKKRFYGEYTPSHIRSEVMRQPFLEKLEFKDSMPQRIPKLCAGCPHRAMFYVIKKLGLAVVGDVGCCTVSGGVDTVFCAGASISAAHGIIKARGKESERKLVSVVGDSAFLHSGLAALMNVVYNKGTGTVSILYNSISGITGGQLNPASGYTIRREPTKRINISALCRAVGVEHIRTVDPLDIVMAEIALKEETERAELSVIIASSPCLLLKGVKNGGCYIINERCNECGACLKLECPAIQYDREGLRIDGAQCTGCGLCSQICLWGAIDKLD